MADISTAVSMARVPILGENGRISDDYIPAAIGEGVKSAEAAATRAETAATNAKGSATAASQSATGAQSSASAASTSATKAQQSAEAAGGYDLADLLHRIDVLYAGGRLTDAEREDLYVLARAGAKPEDSLAPVVQRVEALEAWRTEVDAKLAELSGGGGEVPGPEEPADEWPEYVQPTGAHDAYYAGDKVTWQGGRYVCTAPEGVACVWDPGTYPAYWEMQ